MKSSDKYAIVLGWCILLITSLVVYAVSVSLSQVRKERVTIVNELFEKAVYEDKLKRLEGIRVIHWQVDRDSPFLSDSIKIETAESVKSYKKTKEWDQQPFSEKRDMTEHIYLMIKKPIQVSVLDSLFRATLLDSGIDAQTAVCYTKMEKGKLTFTRSCQDESFYVTAIAVSPVLIGSDELGLKLEGFVKFSFISLLKSIPYLWGILFLYLFVIILIFVFGLWIRKRNSSRLLPTVNLILPIQEIVDDKEEIPFLSQTPPKWIKITEELLLDEQSGILKYKDATAQLVQLRLSLFLFLLKGPAYYQSYEDLKKAVWENEKYDNVRVNKMIGRLREDLEPIKIIEIDNIRNKGYQLIIKDNS